MTVSAPPGRLDFGDQRVLDAAVSAMSRGLRGSEILRIAAEIRVQLAAGRPICNLTVGDFDPRQFPIPSSLAVLVARALEAGETNYPPSDGLLPLREAVIEYIGREHGVTYPLASVVITSGGRPAIYAVFRCLVDPGDTIVSPVPNWNTDYYATLVGARLVAVPTSPAHGFQPRVADLAPHLESATLLCLCSPGNPTGTILPPEELRAILEAVVAENTGRAGTGRRPLFVLHDLMYGALVFGGAAHAHPLAVAPDAAPWVVMVDGISKAFAGTGLRVGWAAGPPAVIARLRDFIGHVGAWAPRPEQVATAAFLGDAPAIAAFRERMEAGLTARLDTLVTGLTALKAAGHPVDFVRPQGAMYLSLRLDLVGRAVDGTRLTDNESIRRLLLDRAGLAVVPFQAFGVSEESGWFRLSAGAVSVEDIEQGLERLGKLLQEVASSRR
ncbi:MAG TPA: aminotransferase class I/II-fold pyridoxal phosphate-dependent enzyme [Gemmatimonadales bacterium]|nr:aminotransferase class I/II-fold pyridoxal phosphate-dependent enzyme [Gemmatimonadales bacterium]